MTQVDMTVKVFVNQICFIVYLASLFCFFSSFVVHIIFKFKHFLC